MIIKKTSIKTSLTFLFLLQLILSSAIFAQSKAEKIDELMNKYEEYKQFNGSLLVAENGEVVLKKGYGLANMEWDIPNAPNTKHRLGSITKQFTAMIIMQLLEEGKIDLDKTVSAYLPDYPNENGDQITIHHLLTHTSGIPNYTSFPGFFQEKSRDPYSPNEFTKTFADSSLAFTPGEKFSYSNSGYFLLGVIIEEVTGKSYEEVLKDRILEPLDMKDTGFDHHESILKNRASGYDQRGNVYRNTAYLDMSIPYAAGSLYSTVEDLYKWNKALISNKLISKMNKELMFSPHISSGRDAYGYGWSVGNVQFGNMQDSVKYVAHGGGINGFNTQIFRIPEDEKLIVLLNNTGGKDLNSMTKAIAEILYDQAYQMPKRDVAMALDTEISENGLQAAIELYSEIKNSDEYDLNEGQMNSLGYELLRNEKTNAAIEIFKLNVQAFPNSGNVYDSLGEAYLANGDTALAIKNYKRSIEIDPSNTNAVKILKDLEGKSE